MAQYPFMDEYVGEEPPVDNSIIQKLEELPDGDILFEIIKPEEESANEFNEDFYRNLAEDLSDSDLSGLAEDLLEEIEQDKDSRSQWDQTLAKGIKYLGYTVEEFKSDPFMYASSAYDTTLSTSLISSWGAVRAELLPQSGPANTIIEGTKEEEAKLEKAAYRRKKFLNNYLTVIDRTYYKDFDRHILFTNFMGNGFKKVWQDPVLRRPLARTISPTDIIVDNNCPDLESCNRITHVMNLSRKEILLKQKIGEFLDIPLQNINDEGLNETATDKAIKLIDGISTGQADNKSIFQYYECHTNRHIDGLNEKHKGLHDEFPFPYIVTIDTLSRKVVKIVRNWEESDDNYKRKEWFVHYKYLPGFGLYGYGILHMLGSNAIALTQILRQGIDAGVFANFPAGIKRKGVKVANNDKMMGPGEFWEIETAGSTRISDDFMVLPYKGADPTLMSLRTQLRDESKQPAGVAETQISDKHTELAMGTILALMSNATIVQSSVMRCYHTSLSHELQLIDNQFKNHMTDESYKFRTKGDEITINKMDFDSRIRVVPVSDADIDTNTQRILKAYTQVQIAQGAPQLYDMREVHYRFLSAMNVEDIDKILIKPKEATPLDPITENMNALEGKPLKASLEQDHPAHIMSHSTGPAAQNPDMQAHIQVHVAMDYLLKMQAEMGIIMPPLEEMQDINLQNQIAMLAAQASQKMAQDKAQAEPNQAQLMLKDIEQRREAARLKHEETKMRVESDSAKAGLQFQTEMAKIKAEREIAEEKNIKDLEIAELKH